MGFGVAADGETKSGEGKTFELKQFYVKPMDFPEGGDVRITVSGDRSSNRTSTGKRGANGEVLEWHVDFPAGYHLPFLVKMDEYSKQNWTGLRSVEIVADYGEQKLDWEICLDNLVVEFEDGGSGEGEAVQEGGRLEGGGVKGQVMLGDDG